MVPRASTRRRADPTPASGPLGLRRRERGRLRRRFLLLGGAVTGVSALRNLMLARNERRYADVIGRPSS